MTCLLLIRCSWMMHVYVCAFLKLVCKTFSLTSQLEMTFKGSVRLQNKGCILTIFVIPWPFIKHHQQVKCFSHSVKYFNIYNIDWHKIGTGTDGPQTMNPTDISETFHRAANQAVLLDVICIDVNTINTINLILFYLLHVCKSSFIHFNRSRWLCG